MLDSFIFTLLILINTISFYRFSGFVPDLFPSPKAFWLQLFLIYCPLLYVVVYTILKLCPKWCRAQVNKLVRLLLGRDQDHGWHSVPDRLLDETDTNHRSTAVNELNDHTKCSRKALLSPLNSAAVNKYSS